jgi:hypothetical protein
MNLEKLKQVEADFFYRFPGGFDNPEMIAIRKKHKLDKMIEMAQISFVRRNFKLPDLVIENMLKIITRSSLFSLSLRKKDGRLPEGSGKSCTGKSSKASKPCWLCCRPANWESGR